MKTAPARAARQAPYAELRADDPGLVEIRPVEEVTREEREAMFALLDEYYAGARKEQFLQDLSEKESVLLWTDRTRGRVRGFSTLMRIDAEVDGRPIQACFSGDTVVDASRWGTEVTARGTGLLVRRMFEMGARTPEIPNYWFLISSTWKSYRLLPHLFRSFEPAPDRPMSPEAGAILKALVRSKFGTGFDPAVGTLRYPNPTLFRWEVSPDPDPESITDDPWVRFFVERNPEFRSGARLVSLVELTVENLTGLGRRIRDTPYP